MKSISPRTIILAVFCLLLSGNMFAQGRTVTNLNFGWRFHAGDVSGAEQFAFDDSDWRTVDLPHDFQIEQPWVKPGADEKADNTDVAANIKSRLSSRGFKEMGIGWYRLHLTPDKELNDRRLLLDFGGIMYVGDVYLNGELIGGTDYGYVGFEIDVTGKLKVGEENIIAVKADTREPNNSRWYTGGGLYRDVKLIATSKDLYFERHPLYITTEPGMNGHFAFIKAGFTNRGRDKTSHIGVRILSPDGKEVYCDTMKHQRITPSRTIEAWLPQIEIRTPQLWTLEDPSLYTAEVTLMREDGSTADKTSAQFGIRTIEIGPDFGLKLNGKKVLLKGFANHHSLGALGAAAYPRAIEKRIMLMKEFGVNHIRTSHNPYSREFIELCDKHGILVVDELYDKWTRQHTGGTADFESHWQKEVPEWVKRDRNSPSVVMWSLGNELQQDPNMPYNDFGVTMYKLMKTLLQRYDTTRPVTVAMHPRYRNWETDSLPCDLAMETDVQAYNYRYMYFPGDGKLFPWMTFYQSEASVSAMGPNFFEMDNDKVIGLAYWGAIDYLGESNGWPAKGWAQGVFDLSLQPKPMAYLMKSMFSDEPTIHIGVIDDENSNVVWNDVQVGTARMSESWNRKAGTNVALNVYTNCERVDLLVNGKKVATKENCNDPKSRNKLRFDHIAYEKGSLEAVGYISNKVVARHKIETSGEAKRLKLVADNQTWNADGMDLMHVRVTAVDDKGRRCWNANQLLSFEVEGDAKIVAVDNGNIASDELHTANQRHLFNGSALVILRAGRQAGKVTLKVKSDDFKTITLSLIEK
ncbi:MAG: DUF4982 domain-containing protein [Prevotella sp.]|nr:DUF4982 domain-containing protein [Prevotella sp.]